jgi:aromatic ring-opening dioxygenase catalytic subunit (LigB family)
MADRCVGLLQKAGLKAKLNQQFDWIHDTYLILIRMFPGGCPPTTIISMNARYDPHYHVKVGSALRELRREDVLFIGTGGAVHNLYRNNWYQMLRHRGKGIPSPGESFCCMCHGLMPDLLSIRQLRHGIAPGWKDA